MDILLFSYNFAIEILINVFCLTFSGIKSFCLYWLRTKNVTLINSFSSSHLFRQHAVEAHKYVFTSTDIYRTEQWLKSPTWSPSQVRKQSKLKLSEWWRCNCGVNLMNLSWIWFIQRTKRKWIWLTPTVITRRTSLKFGYIGLKSFKEEN